MVERREGMPFGFAIASLKAGARVAREGWNGRDMFVFLELGNASTDFVGKGPIDGVPQALFRARAGKGAPTLPTLCMKTASGAIVTGWLASQTDMLAEDWFVVVEQADA